MPRYNFVSHSYSVLCGLERRTLKCQAQFCNKINESKWAYPRNIYTIISVRSLPGTKYNFQSYYLHMIITIKRNNKMV